MMFGNEKFTSFVKEFKGYYEAIMINDEDLILLQNMIKCFEEEILRLNQVVSDFGRIIYEYKEKEKIRWDLACLPQAWAVPVPKRLRPDCDFDSTIYATEEDAVLAAEEINENKKDTDEEVFAIPLFSHEKSGEI